jgi:hypothetical protein
MKKQWVDHNLRTMAESKFPLGHRLRLNYPFG